MVCYGESFTLLLLYTMLGKEKGWTGKQQVGYKGEKVIYGLFLNIMLTEPGKTWFRQGTH
jgi:hypothetical protein